MQHSTKLETATAGSTTWSTDWDCLRAGQHARDMQLRSLAVTQLVDLLSVPGAQWINLQHGDVQDDLRLMQEQHGIQIHDWPEQDLKQNLDHVAARIADLL